MSTNNEPTNELATNSLQAQSIDCVGTTYVKPVMWRTRLASVIALLIILLGVFLYSQGLFSIGIALITVCLACLAILGIIVRASAARFMGYRNTACEDTPLGRYLSSDKTTIRLSTPTLSDKEAATIDLHRATEAVLVNEWVVNARTPRRIQVRSDDGTALAGRAPACLCFMILEGLGETAWPSREFMLPTIATSCSLICAHTEKAKANGPVRAGLIGAMSLHGAAGLSREREKELRSLSMALEWELPLRYSPQKRRIFPFRSGPS